MNNNLVEQDKQHRTLALDATQSFIVQAPAGSGKTELLIQRLLTLLIHVNSPEEILAITFTKKAANEMRARVIKALKNALHEPEPESAHGKQTWTLAKKVLEKDNQHQWHLINNPNQLRIQTIDSLCSYLTKQLPLLSHFGAQPDVADNPNALYREAAQEVIMHVEENFSWSQAITRLLIHLDNDLNKLHELLVNLLAKRDQWLSYIQLNSENVEIKKQLEHQLGLVISDNLMKIKSIFPQEIVAELLAIARFAAGNLSHYSESEVLSCLDITSLPDTNPKNKKAWLGLAKLLMTKSFSWRKKPDESVGFPTLKTLNKTETVLHREYRQRLNNLILTLHDREDLRLSLIELFFLPDPHYNAQQWEVLQALLEVLKIAAAQLRLTFQQHGQIDFIENTQAALTALGNEDNPTDLALALDYQIKHILIDEFQDTSYTQYQLLSKLTQGWEQQDGRSLFVVGDPMQSIYRFREAEVGLFIRMRHKGIHHLKLTPLTLAVNFRSHSSIVDWNNVHFAAIFPSFNDMASGAVSYSPSASHQIEKVEEQENKKSIAVKGFVDASDKIEAEHVIELIKQTLNNFPQDKIAILVRSRPHLKEIIPALKKAKINYSAIDIDPLASRQHIHDLFSLTCALLHPADRIAWLSLLRSPWCGLSLADLLVIAGKNKSAAIYHQLEKLEVRQKLSDDGRKRIEKIFPILAEKINARDRYPLRTWIESTWLLLGGPTYLNDYNEIDDANAFFKLLDTFSSKYSFINLDKLKERINQLYASTRHANANVQIMTIHTAKGLEFDTVVLPQLHKKNPSDDKALLSWMERPLDNNQTALLLAPVHGIGKKEDSIYEYIARQQRVKSDFETDRLFYVAATRAKKRLYLFFNTSSKNTNEIKDVGVKDSEIKDGETGIKESGIKIESGSFLEKIWPHLEKQQHNILTFTKQEIETTEIKSEPKRIQRIHSEWINPIKELQSKKSLAHKNNNGFQLNDVTPKNIGIVVHRILQQISQLGFIWWTKQTLENHMAYIQSQLQQLGVSANKIYFAVKAVMQAIKNMLADEKGKWILHKHDFAKSEYAVTAFFDNKFENLVIDRMFVDEENTLWIIDYKTAELTHSDMEKFLLHEEEKYQKQMHKYYLALKDSHAGCVRLGLYFPALPAWKEIESFGGLRCASHI